MALKLHEHPFASYCWKVLIALYERGVEIEREFDDPEDQRQTLARIWPLASIPFLVDEEADRSFPESSVIIEYLDRFGEADPMVPREADAALEVRAWDRIMDGHVMAPMQAIVSDALRPADHRDQYSVDEARAALERVYPVLDARMRDREWLASDEFSLADCAAASSLFYARVVHRWEEEELPHLTRYFNALEGRPSVKRVIDEARPYRPLFPLPWPDYVS